MQHGPADYPGLAWLSLLTLNMQRSTRQWPKRQAGALKHNGHIHYVTLWATNGSVVPVILLSNSFVFINLLCEIKFRCSRAAA